MTTPICDFVKKYVEQKNVRLHMPGHKGKNILGVEAIDITEIDGADELYMAEGIIAESQKNASALFGTAKTLYSTEGSSLCIRAMVYLLALKARSEGRRPIIAAGRNAHKSFLSAVALSDVEVQWIYGEDKGSAISCEITESGLDAFLGQAKELPVAVYVTSPDYLGNMLDIEAISKVCKKYGVVLAVDNAHGAYLKLLPKDSHPISLGADICCDSAHKTFPALTGSAYLHLSVEADELFLENAQRAMKLFASTSPSYLVLQSLDVVNAYIDLGYRERIANLSRGIGELRRTLEKSGYSFVGNEPAKLTIKAKSYGYSGYEMAELLKIKGFVCEFYDNDYVVLMITPLISRAELEGLKKCLLEIPQRKPITEKAPGIPRLTSKMSVRQAIFSVSERIDVKDSEGRILADSGVSCPPAIPVVVSGEMITADAIECMRYYGIKDLRVVKE